MKRSITQSKQSELQEFAEDLISLLHNVEIKPSLLTPTNYRSEQRKFFKSEIYNPQFTYQDTTRLAINTTLAGLWRQLTNLHLPLDLEDYIETLIYHIALLHRARIAIGTPLFSPYAQDVYKLDIDHVAQYRKTLPLVTFADTKGARVYNAYEIQEYAERYISSHAHLKQFGAFIDHCNTFTVMAGAQNLYIGSRVKRNEQNMVRLMVHEIESHLVQKHNSLNGGPLFSLKTQPDRELYAEGMAIYNEITTGTITKSAYDLYFYRLQAVSMMHKSFREIYTYLSSRMSKHKAFITTARVKRGLSDTSKPGGYPKDALYLLGYKKVSDYLFSGGNIGLLYQAQVPELGNLLHKYHILREGHYGLPSFYS